MTLERGDARVVPVSVKDERGEAFASVLTRALAEPDFVRLLHERIDIVDDRVLPFLIREFSIEEFVEPGMSPAVIRRLLKGSFALHARKGFIDGVRTGLGMLGIRITGWRQWFEQTPPAAPGTHVVTITIDDVVFDAEGHAITTRLQRAIGRMIAGMKRHSQDIMLRLDASTETPGYIGALCATRLRVVPNADPITVLAGTVSVYIGAMTVSRIRIIPGA